MGLKEMLIFYTLVVASVGLARGVSVCNQTVPLNSSDTLIDLDPQSKYPLKCTWNLTAPQNSTIVIKVIDILMVGNFDRVIFLDGAKGNHTAIQQCGVGCSLNEAIIVSSTNSMQVIIEMDSSTNDARVTSIVAHSQDQGGRLYDSGVISLSNSTSDTVIYHLHSTSFPDVQQIQVFFIESLMNPTSTIKVYDGITESTLLANFNGRNQFVPITASGKDLLVVVQNMGDEQQYLSGHFDSVSPGCHKVSPGSNGEFSLERNNLKTKCDWFINPTSSKGNIFLEITSTKICGNETIVIYEGLSVYGQKLATITKEREVATYPKFYSLTSRGLSVFVTKDQTGSNCTSLPVISGTYTTVPDCSADLKSSGTITSPSFPNQYPLNAVCKWSTKTLDRPMSLYLNMNSLDLTQSNFISVTANGKPVHKYMGNDSPSDIVTMVMKGSSADIVFDSNTGNLGSGVEIPGRGFNLTYKVIDCGKSLLLSNGSLSSNKDVPVGAKECIWVITVPPKSGNDTINIVSFDLTVNGNKGQNLELRDGGRGDSPLLNFDASKGKSMTYLTRYNELWIHYKMKTTELNVGADNKTLFNIVFKTYSCNSKHQCKNGVCLHPDWKCNGMDDCGDNTDELGCSSSTTTKGVKIWLAAVLCILSFLIGVILVIVIPALYRKWKLRKYSEFRDLGDPAMA